MNNLLTERERTVLHLLAQGSTNKEISSKLHISVHTTKAHLESIYYKFDVVNRLQAVLRAIQLDVLDIKKIVI